MDQNDNVQNETKQNVKTEDGSSKKAFSKKVFQIAAAALIVMVVVTLLIFALLGTSNLSNILKPVYTAFVSLIYGLVIAFLVNPIMMFFDKRFAFLTADDPVPEIPEKVKVPKAPKKPEKPVPEKDRIAKIQKKEGLAYYRAVQEIKVQYSLEMEEYKRASREYSDRMREIALAEKHNRYVEKNRERIQKKAIRIQSRHDIILARTYSAGEKDRKTRYLLRRVLSVLVSSLLVIALLAGFAWSVAPSIVSGTNTLIARLPSYVLTFTAWLTNLPGQLGLEGDVWDTIVSKLNDLLDTFYKWLQDLAPVITTTISSAVVTIKDFIIGCFFAIYFLMAKERLLAKSKKLISAVLPVKAHKKFFHICTDLNQSFGSFITAKLLDSFIIGCIFLVTLLLFGIPYAPLLSLVMGVTNIIPFFGPIIGAIPTGFIVLVSEPGKLITFILIVLIVQQFDGNVLGPRLLGAKVKTTALGILASLTVFASFWGITGLVIAVPVFAVLYELIKAAAEASLQKKGLKVDTRDYYYNEEGIRMCDEARVKEQHKSSFSEVLGNTSLGRLALKAAPVAQFTEKVEQFDKSKTEEESSSLSEDLRADFDETGPIPQTEDAAAPAEETAEKTEN